MLQLKKITASKLTMASLDKASKEQASVGADSTPKDTINYSASNDVEADLKAGSVDELDEAELFLQQHGIPHSRLNELMNDETAFRSAENSLALLISVSSGERLTGHNILISDSSRRQECRCWLAETLFQGITEEIWTKFPEGNSLPTISPDLHLGTGDHADHPVQPKLSPVSILVIAKT